MKAAAIGRYKQPLAIVDLPKPSPGPGDLLIKTRAASVNPVDVKIRDGRLKTLIRYSFPLILGSDLAGEVEAVGAGVTCFRPGDAVYARLDKHRIGAFAEYALVSEGATAAKPRNLDWAEAASLPLVGLTAWQVLIDLGRLQPAQKVLIHAGAGGVGTFAIQLAKHLGATVTTTASARNHALVRSLGADVIVDYKTIRFDDVVRDQDMVFDTQGGDTLLRSFTCVKAGGVVVTVGGVPDAKFARAWGLSLPMQWALAFMTRKITRRARQRPARFEYWFMKTSGEQLAAIAQLVENGVIRAVVDKTYPLDAAPEALAYVESGRAAGKVVVSI
jgi:NADPH:quinone reductase-like Zn-dependent oxidoreductase